MAGFVETNKRNPSKYALEEKRLVHFLKRGRKLTNASASGPDPSVLRLAHEGEGREKKKWRNVWTFKELIVTLR